MKPLRSLRLCSVFLFFLLVSRASASELLSICYHDVRDDVVDDLDPDQYAVGTDNLIAQFEWL